MTKNELLAVVLSLFGIGVPLLLSGLYIWVYLTRIKKEKCSAITEGEIVRMTLDLNRRLYAIVEYNVDGKTYTARNPGSITTRVQIGSRVKYNNGYEIGEIVKVHYDPNKPTRWYMKNSRDLLVVPIVFISFGIIFVAIGILTYILNT